MRRLTLLLCLAATNIAAAAPRIACDSPVYDFGTAEDRDFVEHFFEIRNAGDEPLRIGNLRACCGASATISTNNLAPGSNAVFSVKLSLGGRKGAQKKSFYIASNDPAEPYRQIILTGTVVPSLDIEPRAVNFGMVAHDARESRAISIQVASNAALSVTGVVCAAAQFAVQTRSVTNGGDWEVVVSTVPPLPMGVSRGVVTVLAAGDRAPRVDIPLIATVASDIVLVPSEIMVAAVNDSAPAPLTRYAALWSRTGKAFRILTVHVPEPGIQAGYEPMGSNGYRVTVGNILPFEDLGGKDLVILTDHPQVPKVVIPFKVVLAGNSAK